MANLLTASLISTMSGVLSLAFGFASNVVAARMLGAHGTGLVAFAIWFGTTAATVAGLGIQNMLVRYMASADDPVAANRGLVRKLLGPFSILAIAVTIGMLGWAAYQQILGDRAMTAVWVATAVFYFILAYASLTVGAQRGVRDFPATARQVLQGCMIQLPAVTVGAYFFGAAGAIVGQAMRYLPSALALRKFSVGPSTSVGVITPAMKSFSRNTWFSATIGLFIWTRIEFVFLAHNHEVADVGYFAIGMTLAGLVVQLPEQMSAALLPYFGKHHDNNDLGQLQRSYSRVYRWIGLFIFPVCFGGAAIMPELLPLVFGPEFEPAIPAASILLATACITAMTIFPSALISARERSDFFLWSAPAMAVLMVILLAVVVPSGGAVGAAIVRAVVHSGWLILLVGYSWGRLSIAPPVVDLLKIGASAAVCAFAAHLVLGVESGLFGLLLAVIAGALTFAVCLRVTSAIPEDDVEVLTYNLDNALPEPIAKLALIVVNLIAPKRTAEVRQ